MPLLKQVWAQLEMNNAEFTRELKSGAKKAKRAAKALEAQAGPG